VDEPIDWPLSSISNARSPDVPRSMPIKAIS
jgi:hypothetical protein